jgi:hypothetical protein
MDNSEFSTYKPYDELMVENPKRSRRRRHKINVRTSKKNRALLRKWENKIIELNKKINEHIKNQKNCKKQSLEKTLESVKGLKLKMRKQSKKNKKSKKEKKTEKNETQSNFSFFGNQEQKPVEEQKPLEEQTPETPETTVQDQTPETTETPVQDQTTETSVQDQRPLEEPNKGIMASVAESVGLSTPTSEETKKEEQPKVSGGKLKRRKRGGKGK